MRIDSSEPESTESTTQASETNTNTTQHSQPQTPSSGQTTDQSDPSGQNPESSTIPDPAGTLPKGDPDSTGDSSQASSGATEDSSSKDTSSTSSTSSQTGTGPNAETVDCSRGYDVIEDEELRRIATQKGQTLSQLDRIWGYYYSPHPKVTTLTGLRCATNLTSLYLQGQEITSLSELASTPKLRVLNLRWTPIRSSDLASMGPQLARLGQLGLTLDERDISLDWLDSVPGLNSLRLYGPGTNNATVNKIAQIAQKQNLKSVALTKTKVDDLSPLEAVSSRLTTFSLDSAPASVFPTLRSFEKLTRLEIYRSEIKDLNWLPHAPNLGRFYALECRDLASLKGIENLSGLRFFYINHTRVTNLDQLSGLKNLSELRAGNNNQLRDIGGLSSLRKLTDLSISSSAVDDLSPLASLTRLARLNISGSQSLSDLNAVESLGELEDLDASRCNIQNVSKLSKLRKLKKLSLADNDRLSNLEGLSSLPSLETLDLSKCALQDLFPLVELVENPRSKIITINVETNTNICNQPSFDKLKQLSKTHKFPGDGRVGFNLKHNCV